MDTQLLLKLPLSKKWAPFCRMDTGISGWESALCHVRFQSMTIVMPSAWKSMIFNARLLCEAPNHRFRNIGSSHIVSACVAGECCLISGTFRPAEAICRHTELSSHFLALGRSRRCCFLRDFHPCTAWQILGLYNCLGPILKPAIS